MISPIYLNFHELFIDYSNPLEPKVIDIDKLKMTDCSYDEIKSDSQIQYKKTPIIYKPSNDFGDGTGHTGVPNWLQYPDIPTCPKTKEMMIFVCQLGSDIGVQTEQSNIKISDEYYTQYFKQMNFWGDGELYVFLNPESQIACYIIQNT